MDNGEILLYLCVGFAAFSVLIFLFCKFLVQKERRKFKHVESMRRSNGPDEELKEVVSKDVYGLNTAPTAPPSDSLPNGEKMGRPRKALAGEDFYSGKTSLSEHHDHHHSADEEASKGLSALLMGADDDEDDVKLGFF